MKNELNLVAITAIAFGIVSCGGSSSSSSSSDRNTTSSTVEATDATSTDVNSTSTSDTNTTSTYSYTIVDTNQKKCYNDEEEITCPLKGEDYYGQDAQYSGLQASYKNNGDGTITDNNTGLMWTQNQSSDTMPWERTSEYVSSLTTGGYSDWRMPTVKELWSIRDFSSGWPWLNTDYFNLSSDGTQMRYHHTWTSNAYKIESAYQNDQVVGDPHWIVNDWTGHIKAMSGMRFVRAVRNTKTTTYGTNNFIDNGDSTITDKNTGLMWSKNDNGSELTWKEALSYAENATTAGYSDWRLPNIKELQSIANYEATQIPAMDTSVFNLTEVNNTVTLDDNSTVIQKNYPFYWSSTSNPIPENEVTVVDSPPQGENEDGGSAARFAWFLASGYNVDRSGYDLHGAGSVCFGAKINDGQSEENSVPLMVRLVRDVN